MPVTYTTDVALVKETIANNKNVLVFFKVDATTATEYAAEYQVTSLPTFVFFQDQKVAKKAPGSPDALKEIIGMSQ
ncbi:hypothetical protein EIN_289780 [Entamoeba invadens IP1]|uniref:Thioredoxin domain-containing protein n=1 Tax=Entamoeba invadens IP1 TaxID=370355 RepID=L7FL52_ENTIV|nr:hypothetical protein EIN_289780 [Entamoeba invadens IP1]ELP86686.1 hypothetical protein EIN_289780 [Entamoeba invadens IP1]|eukprot:XP_004186032.1 hypothetical protein EIN_289780 [Entamoeba invadens IP1]